MQKHIIVAAAIWAVVTILTLFAAGAWSPFPTAGAEEARVVDDAFRAMSYMAAPVFGLVIAIVGYSMLRFRASGPDEDGEPIQGNGAIPRAWLVITTALCVTVMIFPGLTGLAELRAQEEPDLVVKATAARWSWSIDYGDAGVKVSSTRPDAVIVLPEGQHVRFDVTSVDILHSFWIPAFRLKIDAVPGQVTTVAVTPNREGDRESDAAYRLQCAELCGLQHANMSMPVRVVPQAEFQAWLQQQRAASSK